MEICDRCATSLRPWKKRHRAAVGSREISGRANPNLGPTSVPFFRSEVGREPLEISRESHSCARTPSHAACVNVDIGDLCGLGFRGWRGASDVRKKRLKDESPCRTNARRDVMARRKCRARSPKLFHKHLELAASPPYCEAPCLRPPGEAFARPKIVRSFHVADESPRDVSIPGSA